MPPRLVDFLQNDLGISQSQLRLAQRQVEPFPDQLPMALWQYGLITREQLELLFDWLDTAAY